MPKLKTTGPPDPKVQVGMKISESVLDKAHKVAEMENRNFSNFVETVLKNYCEPKLVGVKHHPGNRTTH